ncbi:MAG: response regulator [Candidatus Moraniibacteriota bacterium]
MNKNNPVVLVVEDEKPLQQAIKIKLEKNNFDPVTARSVEQAINFLKDLEKVDIIWLDHYLLGKDNGLDFVAKVKNNIAWKKIPIFIVSNTASQEKVRSYMQLGIEKYYVKANYRLDDIIEDIRNSLKT